MILSGWYLYMSSDHIPNHNRWVDLQEAEELMADMDPGFSYHNLLRSPTATLFPEVLLPVSWF